MPDRRPPVDIAGLGKRLRDLRGERTLSDVSFSIRQNQGYGLTDSAINMLEHGKVPNPGARTIDALAREYGVNIEFLLYGTKHRKVGT